MIEVDDGAALRLHQRRIEPVLAVDELDDFTRRRSNRTVVVRAKILQQRDYMLRDIYFSTINIFKDKKLINRAEIEIRNVFR